MNNRSIAATLLIVVAFLVSGTALAGATTTGKLPFAFPVFTCNETVNVSGWFRVTTNFVPDGAGGTHDIFHLVPKGTGVGESTGTAYQWNDSFEHFVFNVTAGSTVAANFVSRTNLISRGPSDNSIFYITAHLTVTPDGTTIVDRFDLTVECMSF